MKIISFAHTTPALLAGRKTVTRREWEFHYAQSFHEGERLQAWNHNPRVKGARRVGIIRLTAKPVLSNEFPDSDFEAEGFAYFEEQGDETTVLGLPARELWAKWQRERPSFWVVRFELVEVPS